MLSVLESNSFNCKGISCLNLDKSVGFILIMGAYIPNITLRTLNNSPISLYTLIKQKEYLVLNFGIEWCSKSKNEKSMIQNNELQIPNNYTFVSIFVNHKNKEHQSSLDTIIKYVNENKFNFPIYYYFSNKLYEKFEIKNTPTNVLINKEGKIIKNGNLESLINEEK